MRPFVRFTSFVSPLPKMLRKLTCILIFCCCATSAWAQPANDNPCNATPLTVGATCNYTSFTNVGATATTGVPAPTCGNFQNGDVWFTVTVPAGGSINFDSQIGTMTDGAIAVYTGTCNSLTQIGCDDNSSPNGSMPALGLTGLTPGTTLYVRFWGRSNGTNASYGAFGLCVSTPPANDNPCNAQPLTVSPAGCNYSQGSNLNSTNTTGVPAPGCGLYSGQDVWFSAVVPASGSIVLQTQSGTMIDGAMAVYSGTCSSLSLVSCNDDFTGIGTMPGMTVSNLTPGSTVYIRMWSYNNSSNGTFQICVRENAALAPTNQDCPNAIPICQNVYSNTASYVGTGNILNEISPGISCLASGERNDVWYTFTVQQSGNLNFTITPVNMNDDYDWAVYNLTNSNCASIATNGALSVSCNYSATPGNTGPTGAGNTNNQNAAGVPFNQVIPVTAGQTYVVNISNYSATADGYTINFGASTATIFDNVPPQLTGLTSATSCGTSQLTFTFSENILCSTIQNADFTLSGPGGPYTITGFSAAGCANGGIYGRTVTVNISPAIRTSGSFSFCLVNASGSVTDLCGNVAPPACINFTIDPITVTTSTTNPACAGAATGSMTVSPTSGVSPYTYTWSPNVGNSSTINNAVAGTYNVTVTDANGCTVTQSLTLTNPAPLTATTTSTSPQCSNQTGSASITVAGGTAPITYNWSPSGGTTATASGLAAGTYTVTATDSKGCTVTATVTINTSPPFTATIPTTTNPRCNTGATGSLTATPTTGTGSAPFSYSWSPSGGTGATASNLAAGSYTVTITDSRGCTATAAATLTAPPRITPSITSSIAPTCNGSSNGSLSATATGGTGALTYSWSPSGGTSSTANNLPAGNYTVTITDANGCTAIVGAGLTQPTAVTATTTPVNVTCSGLSNGSASVVAGGGTPGYTYNWLPSGGSGTTASNLAAGNYTVTVTDSRGCTTTRAVAIAQPSQITATSTSTTATCGQSDGSATVTPSGGTGPFTFSWSPTGGTSGTASGLAGGAYAVTITDSRGCTYIANVSVGNTTPATATITSSSNVTCAGGNNGSATVSASGTTGAPTYLWSPGGSTSATASGLSAGTYSVTVTDGSGCNTVATVTITAPTPVTAAISSTTPANCAGQNNGSATALAGGGTPTYNYSWTGGGGTGSTANNLAAGSYTVTITDNSGCTATATATITAPPPVTATVTSTNVTCNGGSNGSASVVPGGGTAPYTFSWAPGAGNGATASGLTPGSYNVTVTDANGCTLSAAATITQPQPTTLTAVATPIPCAGQNTGIVSTNFSGGTGQPTFAWSPAVSTGATANLLAPGTYTITATDANGCSASATATINPVPPILLAINASTNVLCAGGATGSAVATATGGTGTISYSWSPAGGTGSTASGLPAGNYTVTVTDGNGCTQTAVTTITQPPALNVTATVTSTILCAGAATGSVSASAGGGTAPYSYNWGAAGSGQTLTGLTGGSYSVTVTDANGCTTTSSTSISAPTPLAINITPTNATCGLANGSIAAIVSGGTGIITYSWTPSGSTQFNATGLNTGSYTVTVTDANGCTRSATSSITNTPPFVATANVVTNVLCNGGSTGSAQVVPTQASSPIIYSWSPSGGTSAAASNLAAGNYLVTATDAAGCTFSARVTVTQPPAIIATSTPVPVNCNGGNTGSASVAASGGTTPLSYQWSPGGSTGSSITGLTAGSYVVTVTDGNGCTLSSTAVVNQPAPITIATTPTAARCDGASNGSIQAVVTGGSPTYSYSWAPAGGTTVNATGLAAGSYTITVTDANGCTSTRSTTVTQPAPVTITTSTTPALCGNSNGTASATTPTGGTSPYTYSWTPGNLTGANPTGLAAGAYTVTVTDANGCTGTGVATVSNTGGPTAIATTNSNVTCPGGSNGSATVTVSAGTTPFTYSWSPSGGTGVTASNLAAGTYTVTIRDANNCITTVNTTVTAPSPIVNTVTATNVLCNGGATGSANVSGAGGTGALTYVWNPGGYSGSSATGLTAGNYTVTATDANGCTGTALATITQPAIITASATATPVSCNGGSNGTVSLTASGGTGNYSYSWTPSGGNSTTASGLSAGTYNVTVTDANGCTATASITVTQPGAIVLSTTSNPAVCGSNNGSASAAISGGGTPPFTYSWSTGSTSSTITGLGGGSYTVTATDARGCTSTAVASVSNIGGPTVTSTVNANVSCYGGNNGSATINIQTPSTPPYTYSWSPSGGTGATANNLTAGNYTVSIVDNNGCVTTSTVVIQSPTAINLTTSSGTVSCFGNSNGTVSVISSGGTSPYSYSWSNGGGTSSTASNLLAGNYTVTVTDASNCTATATASVIQPSVLTSTPSNTAVTCNGGSNGSASVLVNGGTSGYTYSWSPAVSSTASASGLNAGAYIVTVTDAAGCTTSNTINISQPGAIIPTTTTVDASCGAANGSASVSVSGGNTPFTYAWSPGLGTGSTFNNLAAGTYSVTVTDANGCTNTATASVGNIGAAVLNISVLSQVNCYGGNNGSALVSVVTGTGPFTYSWSPNGGSNPQANNLTAGTYTVSVTDVAGCVTPITVTISQPQPFSASATATNVNCFGGVNGSASVAPTGGTAPYTYSWSSVPATTQQVTSLPVGTYTAIVTDAAGCTASASTVITQPSQLTVAASNTSVSCNGGSDGSVSAVANGGNSGYAYSWAPGGGTTANVSGLTAGLYTVTVTDASGCTSVATTTVNQPGALGLATNAVSATCGAANGSASISVSGGSQPYSYSWSSGSTASTAANLSAGTYTVTVTDAGGCTSSATVAVPNAGAPTISVTGTTQTSCNGGNDGTGTVLASGGNGALTFAWSPYGGSNATASGLSAGSYTVSVTDAIGCTSFVTVNIGEPAPITLNTTSTPANCTAANGSADVSVSGGTGSYTYSWTPSGGSAATATGLTSGNYSVTATDLNGCSQTTTVTVGNTGGGTVGTTQVLDASCNSSSDGSVTVAMTGGTAPFNYSWSPSGGSAATATGLAAGSYTVTVTDVFGCVSTLPVTINEPAAVSITTSTTPAACNGGTNGSATAIAIGGTAPYQFLWNPSGNATSVAVGLSQGVYTVSVTDANGCSQTTTAVVNSTANIQSILTTTDISCSGDSSGSASINVTGGTPPYTYSWSGSFGTGTSASGMPAGAYQVTITDMMGCSYTQLVTIQQPAPLSLLTAGSTTICTTQVTTLSATVTGGTPPYTYNWSNGATGSTQSVSPVNSSTYSVAVTDANGCPVSGPPVSVGVYPPLQIAATGSDTLCPGTPFNVQAAASGGDGNYTYTWNDGSADTAFSVTPYQDSILTVTVVDGCGQPVSTQVYLGVSQGPRVNFTPFTVIDCAPVTVNFNDLTTAPSGSTYSWNFGDQQTSSQTEPVHTYDEPGVFSVTLIVTSGNNCADTLTIPNLVNVSPPASAGFIQSATDVTTLNSSIDFTNTSAGAVAYQWNFGDGSGIVNTLSPTHRYEDTGTYQVQLIATSPLGCIDTIISYVHVTEGFSVYIPSAFTPNGDHVNDGFMAYCIGIEKYDLFIFDRWGLQIFHSTSPEYPWNGTVGGQEAVPCQNDVYEYLLKVRDVNGAPHTYLGHVTLVR